ncbi:MULTISPECIES: hypothetical protein [Marinobacter]|uniref:Uncharacterized protein n=1 Tax=Marinobacter nauticus (strain ATCC 700491 / DSM 11845 / VT8) TaxID=351348 RepID=A1U837_MARN8|nr:MULTISPECIES: hypothetical protein [Marinobacter]ABM21156.1 hypothetical protein Maqu_4305 [Marinobacter nauticus VT8]
MITITPKLIVTYLLMTATVFWAVAVAFNSGYTLVGIVLLVLWWLPMGLFTNSRPTTGQRKKDDSLDDWSPTLTKDESWFPTTIDNDL